MPLYEYKCEKCGHEDSEIRKVENRNNLKKCERVELTQADFTELHPNDNEENYICGGEMKLKISNTSFKFKD